MPGYVSVGSELVEEARRLGKHKTKKEAATTALREYVQRHCQPGILEWVSKTDFDPNYGYKRQRHRKHR